MSPISITTAELKFRLSSPTGPGNSTAGIPATSLGGFMSSTDLGAGMNTLFDDITGAENTAGAVDYRCLFVYNSNATLTLSNAVVYLSAETGGGASISLATDNIAASAASSASPQAATIANETSAPSGVGAFSAPTTAGAGLALGDIGPNQCRAVWVRRTATNSAALSGDSVTFAVTGDTL